MFFTCVLSRVRAWRWLGVAICVAGAFLVAHAQPGDAFDKASLAWRTALHFDPGAEAPLGSLVELYQREGRLGELLALYTEHVAQYPQDEGAAVVLARLYVQLNDSQASSYLDQALKKLPDSALLKHVQARLLMKSFDARALEALDAAVALETKVPARRAQWLGELVKAAAEAAKDDLVAARMKALVAQQAFTSAQRVQWARRCLEAGLKSSAAAVLAGADFSTLSGDDAVDARFVQARVALLNGLRAEAAVHARGLQDLLAADHWRHQEALALYWQTADEEQREAALVESRRAWQSAPASDAAALSHGDLLLMAGRRDEALSVWQKSLEALPGARLIEGRITETLQTLRREDELLAFLAARIQSQPQREDLRLLRSRLLMQLGRAEEGLRELDALLAKSEPGQRITIWLQTARWLRLQNLFGDAARVLEVALQAEPQRWEVRKELAEVYVLLKREGDAEKLFDAEMGGSVTPEVRMEVAQFLVSRRMWTQARRQLELWLKDRPDEFDALLLLARVESLSGRAEVADQHLAACRQLCDTEARYAAWLAVAWEKAAELETTEAFVDAERQRLWPEAGGTWDAWRLQKLALLAEQTMQSNLQRPAENLLRKALDDVTVPPESKRTLRRSLIGVLDGREDQRKALEMEIQVALAEPGEAGAADLRLRLALMYFDAQRNDLARTMLREVNAGLCEDGPLLQRAITVARQLDEDQAAVALARRLVVLQPDEKGHWLVWTSLMVEAGDESTLRLALREMRARSTSWKLGEAAQDSLRRHLAASAWRTVSTALAEPSADPGEALLSLGDLEQTEQVPQRRAWVAWARGMLALRAGDETGLADARAALAAFKGDWVMLPDGLSLSLQEAQRLLELPKKEPGGHVPVPVMQGDYSKPGVLAWSFEPMNQAEFQRWTLTADGRRFCAQDSQGRIYMADRRSGKLLWHRRLESGAARVSAAMSWNGGGEQIGYPKEWCAGRDHLCVLDAAGLVCLSVADGSPLWRVATATGLGHMQGVLAEADGRVLWWRAAQGRLEAMSMTTGKLLWSREIPALNQNEPLNPHNPVWLMSGICRDAGHALVWGNGTALVNLEDGALIWKASLSEEALSFPLQLDESPSKGNAMTLPGAHFLSGGSRRVMHRGGQGMTPIQLGNVLTLPLYGYPGMYGSTMGSPWLEWGGEGVRWLQGDGVWLLGQGVSSARYSVLGFPVSGSGVSRASSYLSAATVLGTVGRNLIVSSEQGLHKVQPGGASPRLAGVEVRDNSPAKHPIPAAGMDGTSVVWATADDLTVLDALSGAVLWSQPWPADAAKLVEASRVDMKSWNSLRWSSRGVALYDGRGRTMMVEWEALMAGGDIIVPAGTRKLLCLRCGPEGGR